MFHAHKHKLFSKFLLVVMSAISLISCEMIVDVDPIPFTPEPVINCLFHQGEPFKVRVHFTSSVTDPDTLSWMINDATVTISDDSGKSNILTLIEPGLYSNPELIPVHDKVYFLKVVIPDWGTFTSSDYLPERNKVTYLFRTPDIRYEEGDVIIDRLSVKINDEVGVNNYYDFFIRRRIVRKFTGDRYFTRLSSSHPYVQDEGLDVYSPPDVLFTDKMFNGQSFSIDLEISHFFTDVKSEFICVSGTGNYYNYRRTWIIHESTNFYDFWEPSEPINLYSNIENGLGIFAGYYIDTLAVNINFNEEN